MRKKVDRKTRIRRKLKSRARAPRLSVFVSNKHIYAQIIDDGEGKTLISAKDAEVEDGKSIDVAKKVGELVGKKAAKKKIKRVVFDRGNYKYHGRVKALAEAARSAGLEF